MDYKKASEASNWMLGISLVACGGAFFFSDWWAIISLGVALLLIIGAIIIRIIYWRCPHCKKMLSLGFRREPKICPKCRKPLLKEEDNRR